MTAAGMVHPRVSRFPIRVAGAHAPDELHYEKGEIRNGSGVGVRFTDTYFSKENRYSLGIEAESGRYYASIPVSNGIVDYEEYYELTPEQYARFLDTSDAAIEFVSSCRRREHDHLLLQQPGSNRGIPV